MADMKKEIEKLFDKEVPDVYGLSQAKFCVTLSDHHYLTLANYAANEVRRLCVDLSLWNENSNKNGVEIFTRTSLEVPGSEQMLLTIVSLKCTMHKLETLLTPEYKIQWDSMLDGIEVVEHWPEHETFVVHHLAHKLFTISARDSIDAAKILRVGNEVVFGATGAMHAKYPPGKQYVRTHQYLGGYFLQPSDTKEGHVKFHMLFHADLNMPGPRFISTMASKFVPRIMAQKIDNLRNAIEKFDIQ